MVVNVVVGFAAGYEADADGLAVDAATVGVFDVDDAGFAAVVDVVDGLLTDVVVVFG